MAEPESSAWFARRFSAGRARARVGACLALALVPVPALGQVNTLVIGDSLSREYALEFPALFPAHPESWDSRNWVEILAAHRGGWLDFGGDTAPFAYNDAIPGQTAAGYRDDLDDSDGFILEEIIVRSLVNADIDATARAIIFLGGNDLNQAYGGIYDGGDPALFIDGIADNIAFVADYVRNRNPTAQIVLVNVPHLGVTPDIQADYPTDPVRTGRVTDALTSLSAQLESLAASRAAAFADVLTPTVELLGAAHLCIGCVDIDTGVDPDAGPRHLFPGDGFHPNTSGQALFANAIVTALNAVYGTQIPVLTSTEILESVLGLPADLPYREWIAGFPVGLTDPGQDPERDTVTNIVEYVLDLDPSLPSRHLLPAAIAGAADETAHLQVTWRPRVQLCPCLRIVPEDSVDRATWTPLESDEVVDNRDGTFTARVPIHGDSGFLRLTVETAH